VIFYTEFHLDRRSVLLLGGGKKTVFSDSTFCDVAIKRHKNKDECGCVSTQIFHIQRCGNRFWTETT